MFDFLSGPGFLGTRAGFKVDATLVLIIIASLLLTVGWRLAVNKKFKTHRWVQTSAAILNAIVVLSTMISIFIAYVLPGIPGQLNNGTFAVTTLHAFIGVIGLSFGIYIVLRVNKLVPKYLQFKNYKLFMRTSYALYMLSTLLGVLVYLMVYTGRA